MQLITIEQARDHCKADTDEDDLLTLYVNAAEAACARLANRGLYKDGPALETAQGSIGTKMTDAYLAYDQAVAAAEASDDDRVRGFMLATAQAALDAATLACDNAARGIVVTDDIIGAVLLTTDHFYTNRSNVVTGQGAAAVEVPMSAQNIMWQHRWNGPL